MPLPSQPTLSLATTCNHTGPSILAALPPRRSALQFALPELASHRPASLHPAKVEAKSARRKQQPIARTAPKWAPRAPVWRARFQWPLVPIRPSRPDWFQFQWNGLKLDWPSQSSGSLPKGVSETQTLSAVERSGFCLAANWLNWQSGNLRPARIGRIVRELCANCAIACAKRQELMVNSFMGFNVALCAPSS